MIKIFRRREEGKGKEIPEEPRHEDTSAGISKGIPVLESSSVKPYVRITDEMVRVVGNVSIPDGEEIKGNMVIHGNLTLGSKCHVYGSLSVFGEVQVGEDSIVEGHILAERGISIGRNVKVAGIVDSTEDIILDEKATVEAVSTERSVSLAPGVKINRKVLAGKSLLTKPSSVKRVETELPEIVVEEKPRVEVPLPTLSVAGITTAETEKPKELSIDKVFERMLASKLRSEIREKMSRGTEEREDLANFLSELSERSNYGKAQMVKGVHPRGKTGDVKARPKTLKGFQMKVFGEVFHAGDGVTAVVGDVEIPDGSIVDKPLVVKGKVKIGPDCRILENLKTLGEISMAGGCSVEASVASGDIIELGENIVIEGDVHAESSIKLSQGVEIYGLVDAGGAYVTMGNLASEALGSGEEENSEHNH